VRAFNPDLDYFVFKLFCELLKEMMLSEMANRVKEIILTIERIGKDAWRITIKLIDRAGAAFSYPSFRRAKVELLTVFVEYRERMLNILPDGMIDCPSFILNLQFDQGSPKSFWSPDRKSILVVAPCVGVNVVEWIVESIVAFSRLSYESYSLMGSEIAEATALARALRLCELLDERHGTEAYTNTLRKNHEIST
jgi:hypothetical protein